MPPLDDRRFASGAYSRIGLRTSPVSAFAWHGDSNRSLFPISGVSVNDGVGPTAGSGWSHVGVRAHIR